ncbi:substance-P receptor [Caerostris extrusa]|uniref:Substance-P receptor n=1 Tax=Caerostris extrusa TaxID=172846 RepID=A0AAV4P066_CAEEX|nr:substance-P receptor [Caerostris extrusa]
MHGSPCICERGHERKLCKIPSKLPIDKEMSHKLPSIILIFKKFGLQFSTYYAIIYPLSGRWTKTRGRLVVFMIWFFSLGLSSFQLVHGKAEKFEVGGQELYDCNEIWGEVEGKVYTSVVFSVTFVFPILILSYAYGSIGIKMWGHTLPGNADPSRDRQQLAAKMKVSS